MKIWLDDIRPAPDGWMWMSSAKSTINLLQEFRIEEISLDHDLGNPDIAGTGMDVLSWIEKAVHRDPSFPLPRIWVHSMNAPASAKMKQAIEKISALAAH